MRGSSSVVLVLLFVGLVAPTRASAQLNESQTRDLEGLLAEGQRYEELGDLSIENAEERINLYRAALILDATDSRAIQGLARAQEDLQEAQNRALTADPALGAADDNRRRLDEAERLAREGRTDEAEVLLEQVEQSDPNNPRAGYLREAVTSDRRSRRFTTTSIGAALGLGGLASVLLLLSRKGFFRSRRGPRKKSVGAVQVVEGIGRGLSRTIDQDVFTIGASATDRDGKPLDLVLSDSGSLISRHHCTIRRRKGQFVLIDHSTNGTMLDGREAAGDFYYPLKNNSRIEVAGVSRLTFIYE